MLLEMLISFSKKILFLLALNKFRERKVLFQIGMKKFFFLGGRWSAASQIVEEFCKKIQEISNYFIQFPKSSMEITLALQKLRGSVNCKILQTVGAMDVDETHIEANSWWGDSKVDYFNRIRSIQLTHRLLLLVIQSLLT